MRASEGNSVRVLIVAGLTGAITVWHYLAPPKLLGHHDLLQRLYYIPIVLAGLWFGLRGGLAAAGVISVIYVHHIQFSLGGDFFGLNFGRTLEILLYNVIGSLAGLLAQRQRREHARYRETAVALEQSYSKLDEAYGKLRTQTEQLLAADEQLRRADRLSTLGELSASLAHEIRNPLGSIKGTAEILSDAFEADDPEREFAGILQQEVSRLDDVVSRYLGYARSSEETASACCEPSAVLYDVIQLVSHGLKSAGLKCTLRLAPDLPGVFFDSQQLKQVVLNLILNAQAAMQSGGSLTIEGEEREDCVRLSFADTGHGVAESQLDKLFVPFYTTREGGTGLGLAIVKRIVDRFQARIEVASEVGVGTTVTLDLRRAGAEERRDGQNPAD